MTSVCPRETNAISIPILSWGTILYPHQRVGNSWRHFLLSRQWDRVLLASSGDGLVKDAAKPATTHKTPPSPNRESSDPMCQQCPYTTRKQLDLRSKQALIFRFPGEVGWRGYRSAK